MIKARLDSLEFVGGTDVALSPNSVVVIVGPNNSGKSASLAAIRKTLEGEVGHVSSLVSLSLVKESSLTEVKEFVSTIKNNTQGLYQIPGFSFFSHQIDGWWRQGEEKIGKFLASQILCELTTKTRLEDCDPPPSFDSRDPYAAIHPFQRMYREEVLEARASKIFRAAFKRDLIIHRGASNTVPAYVGIRPAFAEGEDRVSRGYLDRLEALDCLETQGDGIRSFVSIIGRVITESRSIQLIDEPEAFLPPPQARLVAQSILNDSGKRQTILATHSSDVLRGLLADANERVSVVRLTRPSGGAQAHYLEASKIAQLWRDPILRFSNILDGLFHDGVIITEADADCRFYEALSFSCIKDEQRPDIHYAYTGGKDRLAVVIQALAALKVPVATITDFDVLNNDQPLRKIVEAHGGVWQSIECDWRIVKAAVEQSSAFIDGDQFRKKLMQSC